MRTRRRRGRKTVERMMRGRGKGKGEGREREEEAGSR